jgi:hypothetical protein
MYSVQPYATSGPYGYGPPVVRRLDALIEGRRVIYARSAPARSAFTVAPLVGRSRKGVRVSLRF